MLFVSSVVTQTWSIIKLALHQARVGSKRDAFHQQLQCSVTAAPTPKQPGMPFISSSACKHLPRPRVDWAMSDVACPFAKPNLCVSTNSTPVRLDTGYLSVSAHFGVNVKRQDDIPYRRATTCSLLTPVYVDFPEQLLINFQLQLWAERMFCNFSR